MPRIKADDVELPASQLMHEPRRHGAGLDANAGVPSRMPPHHPLDLRRVRGALATPQPAAGLVNNADRRELL